MVSDKDSPLFASKTCELAGFAHRIVFNFCSQRDAESRTNNILTDDWVAPFT